METPRGFTDADVAVNLSAVKDVERTDAKLE